ncbi:tyrosine-type recombinase/integrase [Micromonospora phytophila]|uniref:tyrosine-type recombinase/integrase n=1 Tax=Micromonospora phytophila TaxID=709888 RepID=UPI00202FDE8F|nr:tyrosine-type recombinase/integrase [Micromonospora phytophila]
MTKEQRDEARSAAGEAWQESDLAFTTRYGTQVDPGNFQRSRQIRCQKAGVRPITVHGARRSYATLLADLDVQPRVAMQVLRHARFSVTMEIYTQVSSKATREALKRLGDAIGNWWWDLWRVMKAARRELERARSSSVVWRELRYERATGADGHDYDGNAGRRAKLLWALQYDRRAEDLPLVRWLAMQEARCRSEAPFQGLNQETELVGFLLAEYRQMEDVWLHWEIKRANFDTWCGYNLEHLFAAGVRATIDFVRDSGHADRDDVLELLMDQDGQPCVSEEDLAQWSQWKRARFPADPMAEDPLTWVERAKLAGDHELAREWLDRWAAGRQRDKDTLSQLRYQLADLGAFAEAAGAQRESLVFAHNAWDSALAWRSLAGLERQAGNHGAAWDALRECRRALNGVSGWPEVGLGRMYVEELFLLARSAGSELADAVFAEADRQARDVPRLALVVFQAAAEAADTVGNHTRAKHYQKLRDAEQSRIDVEMGRARS